LLFEVSNDSHIRLFKELSGRAQSSIESINVSLFAEISLTILESLSHLKSLKSLSIAIKDNIEVINLAKMLVDCNLHNLSNLEININGKE
jgi:hypothetical protein